MKRKASLFALLAAPAAGYAQGHGLDREVLHIGATTLGIAMTMVFILTFLKWVLDHRLKNRIIDKGIPGNVVASLLQPESRNRRHVTIKWFVLLAAIGTGLTGINFTLPLGIHSLAILAFSLSAGFLVYYFLTKTPERAEG